MFSPTTITHAKQVAWLSLLRTLWTKLRNHIRNLCFEPLSRIYRERFNVFLASGMALWDKFYYLVSMDWERTLPIWPKENETGVEASETCVPACICNYSEPLCVPNRLWLNIEKRFLRKQRGFNRHIKSLPRCLAALCRFSQDFDLWIFISVVRGWSIWLKLVIWTYIITQNPW